MACLQCAVPAAADDLAGVSLLPMGLQSRREEIAQCVAGRGMWRCRDVCYVFYGLNGGVNGVWLEMSHIP